MIKLTLVVERIDIFVNLEIIKILEALDGHRFLGPVINFVMQADVFSFCDGTQQLFQIAVIWLLIKIKTQTVGQKLSKLWWTSGCQLLNSYLFFHLPDISVPIFLVFGFLLVLPGKAALNKVY